MKRTVLIATILLLAAGIAWWRIGSDGPAGGVRSTGAPHAGAPAETSADSPLAPIGAVDESEAAEVPGEPPLPPPVDLATADRDLDLFGRIVDAAGDPVPGAAIECVRYPGRRTSLLDPEAYALAIVEETGRSAADGTFAIRLARGDLRELRVTHPDFAETCVPGCQAGERVEVVLQPGARIELRTIDEAGAPVAEVRVRLWYRGTGSSSGQREAATDADGFAGIGALSAGSVMLELEHDRLGSPAWQDVEIAAGAVIPLEVVMPEGRTITGTVTDHRTGRPIAGARIGEGWTMKRPVETDAQGRFRIIGYSRIGRHDLAVSARGYGRERREVPVEDDGAPIDFVLFPAEIAVGRITDSAGIALAGVAVRTVASVHSGGEQRIDSGSAVTAEDGSFRLDSLHPELPHTLVVMEPGYGRFLLDFDASLRGPAGTIDLGTIALPPAGAIEGELVDEDGEPMPGEEVYVSGNNADRGRLRPGEQVLGSFYGKTETRRTDDLGRFRYPDLAPGKYRVYARPRGRPQTSEAVELATGAAEPAFVRLEAGGGDGFRIAVEGPDGAPLPGVAVQARGHDGSGSVRQETDAEGIADFAGLPGPVTVSVLAPKGLVTPARIEIEPRGQTERVRLARAAVVSGIVTSLAGEPKPGFIVRAKELGRDGELESEFSDVTDGEGRFSFDVPDDATVDLICDGTRWVSPATGRTQWVPLEAALHRVRAPAESLHLRLAPIPKDGSLSVRVVDETGAPLEGTRVFARNWREANDGMEAVTDAQGVARFDGLHRLEHSIGCTPREREPSEGRHWIHPMTMRVLPEGQEVRLELVAGRLVIASVVDAAGAPVDRIGVDFLTSRGRRMSLRTESGFFGILLADGETADVTVDDRAADGKRYRGELRGISAGDERVRIVVRPE